MCSCVIVCSFLALNCPLQIEQVNSDCDNSDDDVFALSLRSLPFFSF